MWLALLNREPGPAGDGTELADHQPVLVDGIVIQHIVFFKVNRVINKVVVYGIVPDNNTGMLSRHA